MSIFMKNWVSSLPWAGSHVLLSTTQSTESQKEFQTIVDELLSRDDQPEYPEELEFMKDALLSDNVKKAVRNLLLDIAGRLIRRVNAKVKAEKSNKKPAKIVNIDGSSYVQIPFLVWMQNITFSRYDDSELSDAFRSLYYKQLRDFSIVVRWNFLDKDQEGLIDNNDWSWSLPRRRQPSQTESIKTESKDNITPAYLVLWISGYKKVAPSEITHIEDKLKSEV